MENGFIKNQIECGSMTIPVVSASWSLRDRFETLKVRWSIGRMNYKVEPGLYAVGSPDKDSHVFVAANYKLSFDHLRRSLAGHNGRILVIDTKGVNVWCAAGKKTFSTDEVVRRIRLHKLDQLVNHRKIILPQLGATGVSAHVVREQSGFSVIYGPVKAEDIPSFLEGGLRATETMRTVRFPLAERLKLIPVDLFYGKYYMILVPSVFLILSGLYGGGYSVDRAISDGGRAAVNLLAGYITGAALTPVLLPWIPFRRFALKGLALGMMVAAILLLGGMSGGNRVEMAAWFLMVPAIASFMAMNFTGSSTFTSLSGVQKEMKVMLPVQIILAGTGLVLWIVSRFYNL